jgi:hypothetical protein
MTFDSQFWRWEREIRLPVPNVLAANPFVRCPKRPISPIDFHWIYISRSENLFAVEIHRTHGTWAAGDTLARILSASIKFQ